MARSFTPTVNFHVTYYKATTGKPRPATVVSVGSTNGGIVLRVRHNGEVYGNGTTGILRRVNANDANVWNPA